MPLWNTCSAEIAQQPGKSCSTFGKTTPFTARNDCRNQPISLQPPRHLLDWSASSWPCGSHWAPSARLTPWNNPEKIIQQDFNNYAVTKHNKYVKMPGVTLRT